MSQARVESLEVIKSFKAALVKFIESANVALTDAESDLHRTRLWLELEQSTYWQGQIKKRQELLARAEEALRSKKIFKDVTGARQSYVDEEKAVRIARARLEEANQKLAATQQWKRRMDKITHDYKGSVAKLATSLAADLPNAVVKMENLLRTLEQYIAAAPTEVTSQSDVAASTAGASFVSEERSMARAAPEEPEKKPEQSDAQSVQTPGES
jgi:hypothetical protein